MNQAAPVFSVVIPTYNRASSVRATVEQVLALAADDVELIVIDDGSSDDTLAVLAGLADARLSVHHQNNAGPAAARNRGVELARGHYVAFLDSDDSWLPGYFEQARQALHEDPECFLYGRILVDRGVGRYWVKPDRGIEANESIYEYLYVHSAFVQTSTMIVPRDLAARVRWDESVTFGDNDQFAIDCWRTGIRFHLLKEPLTLYADVTADDALSQLPLQALDSPRYTRFFDWMATQREHMTPQAWDGFQARFETVRLARARPLRAMQLLCQAWRTQAMSAKGVARQALQAFAPRQYRALTTFWVKLRGRPWPQA